MESAEALATGIRSQETPTGTGEQLRQFIEELYPICRSITGDGLRETLAGVGRRIPLSITEVPTGTPVFDWTVPREWNIRDAYVKDSAGNRVVDFRRSNLHVVNYSVPVHARLPLSRLREHLHSLPEQPRRIPYITSYYHDSWGFCLEHDALCKLEEGEYEVAIDSALENGALTYGECLLTGEMADEVLISAHCCHPSLCNDNLSGIAVAVFIAKQLLGRPLRYSYRFLFAPGTIGAITWLALNEANVSRIRHGMVLACVGDRSPSSYRKSRQGGAAIDRAWEHVLRHSGRPYRIEEFSPGGFDERQYCSPGFNLPVGCVMRAGSSYPENHTSADDLELVSAEALGDTLEKCLAVIDVLENDRFYIARVQKCEPQLGRRGLYRKTGGKTVTPIEENAIRWVLNLSDGSHGLLEIADRAGLPFAQVNGAAEALLTAGLLDQGPSGT